MAFNVTSLSNYTKTNEQMLLTQAYFTPVTARFASKLTSVKSSIQLPNLSTALVVQTDSCGFNASGDTTITARVLTVGKMKVNNEFCVKDLEAKYTQLLLSPGSEYQSLPGGIDQAYMNEMMGELGEALEQAIWQANVTGSAGSTGILNKFDGLIAIIGAAAGVINANATPFVSAVVTAITKANVISIIDAIVQATPIAIINKPDFRIMVPTDVYRLYQLALRDSNFFHYKPEGDEEMEYLHPGSNVKVKAIPGLNGTNKLYAAQMSNIFVGCDAEGEEDELKTWYSEDFGVVRTKIVWKYGVQIGIPSQVVRFTI